MKRQQSKKRYERDLKHRPRKIRRLNKQFMYLAGMHRRISNRMRYPRIEFERNVKPTLDMLEHMALSIYNMYPAPPILDLVPRLPLLPDHLLTNTGLIWSNISEAKAKSLRAEYDIQKHWQDSYNSMNDTFKCAFKEFEDAVIDDLMSQVPPSIPEEHRAYIESLVPPKNRTLKVTDSITGACYYTAMHRVWCADTNEYNYITLKPDHEDGWPTKLPQ